MTDPKRSKTASLVVVTLAYGVAFAAGLATVLVMGSASPIWTALVADVVATIVIFGWSVAYDNSSFYDPYWSVAPLPIAAYWITRVEGVEEIGGRALLVLSLLLAWGARLTYNWARGWTGLGHEDWRYTDMRGQFRRGYWAVSFVGIHLVPTLMVFLALMPAYHAIGGMAQPLGWLDAVGALIVCAGIYFEWQADRELHRFVRAPHEPGAILRSGLWRYSRHPNYFGENLVWWGLFAIGIAGDPDAGWTLAGPLAMTALFLGVSIPLIEQRSLERRPGYERVIAETSMLVPWWPRRLSPDRAPGRAGERSPTP